MSVNSDEVAAGIIKAVSQIALVVGVVYCLFTYPWLWLLLIPIALVVWLGWVAWRALTRSPETLRQVGLLVVWGCLISLLVGACAYFLGRRDWAGWGVIAGLLGVVVVAYVKEFVEARALKRRGPTKDDEMREPFADPEEQALRREQQKRDSLKLVQDEIARVLGPPKRDK